jgi:oligopeptide/dipeptide ABC transporter ATP-binding protein
VTSGTTLAPATATAQPLLAVRELVTHFPVRSRGLLPRRVGTVHALCGVSFELPAGQTLGLVGESGSGKTTLGRTVLHLQRPTSGSVHYDGREISRLSAAQWRPLRRDLQAVFQDPYGSLDPRMTAADLVLEPLRIHRRLAGNPATRAAELLRLVGLDPRLALSYPVELSGGQRQRLAIARALALQPRLLVLDEPVTALDVSVRAGIVNLLHELQERLGVAYLFIAHDLSLVRHLAHRVAVMYLGQIVEIADRNRLFEQALHPYTQALLSATPVPDPRVERRRRRILLRGEPPDPASPPSGCRFRARCWKYAEELTDSQRARCEQEPPALVDRGAGHPASCHYPAAARRAAERRMDE